MTIVLNNLDKYLPDPLTAEEVKQFRDQYDCSIQQAKALMDVQHRKATKRALIDAIEDYKNDPDSFDDFLIGDVLIAIIKLL